MAYTAANWTRATTTVTVLCGSAHGLVAGDIVYVDFLTGTAPPSDGTFTVLATGLTSTNFTFTAASGTNTGTNTLNFLLTGGNTYTQVNRTLTITATLHGYSVGDFALLEFVGGTYTGDGNYQVLTVDSTSTFTVAASTRNTTSGGVRIRAGTAIIASGNVSLDPRVNLAEVNLTLQCSASVTTDPSLTVTDRRIALGCTSMGYLTPRAEITSITSYLRCDAALTLTPESTLTNGIPIACNSSASLDLTATVVLAGATLALNPPPITLTTTAHCSLIVVRSRDTFKQLLDDAARQCGYQTAASMLPAFRDQLVDDANAAIQELFSRANYLDYFNRTTRTYTLTANTNSVSIETDVQTIHGHVRVTGSKQSIPPSRSQSEIELFASSFLTAADDTSVPHTYFALRHGDATSAYGYGLSLLFAPTPTNNVALSVEVTLNAPRYSYADYLSETSLAIPHRYAASILYPVMRHRVASNRQFVNKEALPQIKAGYQQARELLGYADPAPLSTKNKKTQELEPAAAS